MLAPSTDVARDTARARWTIAAGMLVSAILGGGAVWVVRPSPDLVVAETRPALAVEEPQRAEELVIIPERQPPREAPSSAALSSTPAKSPPPEVLAAGGKPRGVAAASPGTQRDQSFAQVMKGIEAGIGHCIAHKTGKEPAQAIEVRVRFDPSSSEVDQVRVLDMSAANPVAGCVDQAVRKAAPPSMARPNQTFTFFEKKRTMPK